MYTFQNLMYNVQKSSLATQVKMQYIAIRCAQVISFFSYADYAISLSLDAASAGDC